jgi:prohibitin 2
MSNRSPFEEYANRLRAATRPGGRGGFPGGTPKGLGGGLAALVLLGGGAMLFQSAIFNVDGGHRAIKYRRLTGVSKDIYAEGPTPPLPPDDASPELTRQQERS